jgi:diguanylate cyclase (GGDEF)-like protein
VLQNGQVLVAEDLKNSPYISRRIVDMFPDNSMLGLPLIVDGKRLGAVLISYSDYHHFSESDLILGEQVAGHIALAIYKAQLLESERKRTEQLTRANSLILALGRVASRIEITPDPDGVIETLGEELLHLGVNCLVTLRNSSGDLNISYMSLDMQTISLIEQVIGTNLVNYSISPRIFPKYEEIIEKRQAIFTDDNKLIINAALPDRSLSDQDKFAKIIELSEKTRWILLPLTVEEHVIGSLWIWGDNLEESLLPAASIFASQVAVALENARLYKKVQQMAITDDLTGLYNRRGLFELGRREVERAQRFRHPLSAVMIDIDNFKQFNDRYSHATGDEVLRMFGKRCRESLREVDIVGRYGGEEFVILLPENNVIGAQMVAERLRALIEETKTPTDHGSVSVTVSIGVSEVTSDIKSLGRLIARADRALHLAKDGGRNRVMMET